MSLNQMNSAADTFWVHLKYKIIPFSISLVHFMLPPMLLPRLCKRPARRNIFEILKVLSPHIANYWLTKKWRTNVVSFISLDYLGELRTIWPEIRSELEVLLLVVFGIQCLLQQISKMHIGGKKRVRIL